MDRKYAIVLLGCFLVPVVATYLWLNQERRSVKREVKQEVFSQIDLEDCAQFEFTLEQEQQLDWEHSAEFSYKGQKYDVILKKKTHNGTTIYYCWKDVKESAIDRKIATLVNNALGGNPEKDKQHKSVTQLFKDLPEEKLVLRTEPMLPVIKQIGWNYKQFLRDYNVSVSEPPPEFINLS